MSGVRLSQAFKPTVLSTVSAAASFATAVVPAHSASDNIGYIRPAGSVCRRLVEGSHDYSGDEATSSIKQIRRLMNSSMDHDTLPTFDQLPQFEGIPCAWGLFDKNGVKDQVGTLNLLTPGVVLEAAGEIKTGESVVLNWGLENPPTPTVREKFEHKIKDVGKELSLPICCLDDVVTFNTQSSSQWDGFRHWAHAGTRRHYNNIKHEEVVGSDDASLHHWSERGGIVGRGVLVDFASWAERNGVAIEPTTSQTISLDVIKHILAEENVELRRGDILIVRSGLIQAYNRCNGDEEKNALMGSTKIGVQACEEMVRWLWDSHISAVAGDALAFESMPFSQDYALHDYCLVWFGMPIGELWDLEALAHKCKSLRRWTFFVTSAPLNVKGGVGSPPNAIAVF